jgi:hypothetical protein
MARKQSEYYHVTPSYNKEGIQERGLSPYGGEYKPPFEVNQRRRSVHFAKGIDDAKKWGFELAEAHERNLNEEHRTMSIFKVDTKGLKLRKHSTDIGVNEYRVAQHIGPERLSHVMDHKATDEDSLR